MAIQQDPVNCAGERVTPVVWEQGCLEEVCGSCSMLINGRPRQACTALIASLIKHEAIVTLAPFSKFPLVRDLIVDRSSLFENLKQAHAWMEPTQEEGYGPPISQKKQQLMYALSTCMSCACCLEACPQIHKRSKFVGAAVLSQVRLFNAHPVSQEHKQERLRMMMEEGGVSACGNAQNCVEVCPKNIPLTESIADIGRDVTKQAFNDLFDFRS